MFFVLWHARDKEKILSPILFPNTMLSTLLILAVCRMHVMLYHCGSVVEHWTPESQGIRFNSTLGFKIFSLLHACDRQKNVFLYFFTELKPYHLSYSVKEICSYELRNNESGSEKFSFFLSFFCTKMRWLRATNKISFPFFF